MLFRRFFHVSRPLCNVDGTRLLLQDSLQLKEDPELVANTKDTSNTTKMNMFQAINDAMGIAMEK